MSKAFIVTAPGSNFAAVTPNQVVVRAGTASTTVTTKPSETNVVKHPKRSFKGVK
jgi:hypothetical protein